MKLYLDSADLGDVRWAAETGLIDGVTTDPSLLSAAAAAAGRDPRELLGELADAAGAVFAPVVALDADAMVREGRELARLAEGLVVTVPVLEEGLVAVRRLTAEGIAVGVTLVATAMQGLLAAKAGAGTVIAAVGPLDDAGHEGMELVAQLRALVDAHDLETEVVAGALRHPAHALQAALAGADAAAVPAATLRALLVHPLTDKGVDRYLNDWSTLGRHARPEATP